jgi:hypothetical protein
MLHATKLDLPGGGYQTDSVPSWQSEPVAPPIPTPEPEAGEPFSYLPDPEPVAVAEPVPEPAPQPVESYQPPAWQQAADQAPPPPAKPVIRAVPNNPAQDESALNDQERDLLRQLHEELAKREQGPGTPTPPRGTPWPTAQSAQHTGPHRTFDWPSNTGVHPVNGMPPSAGDHPPFPSA